MFFLEGHICCNIIYTCIKYYVELNIFINLQQLFCYFIGTRKTSDVQQTNQYKRPNCCWYIEDILVFPINKRFIFIEWYENKYFTSGDSHEWNMKIFIQQDENKLVFIKKNLNFMFIILNNSVVIKNWWLLYIKFIDLNIERK